MSERLEPSRVFAGKRILFTGATGFVGKVCLSMLLDRYGEVLDRVHVLVRRGSSASAERRFFDKVATSEPFEPLRQRHGGEAPSLAFVQEKCSVLDGDVTDPLLGLTEEEVKALAGKVDLLINCAGLVSFDPSLDLGLRVNTRGVQNAVALCQALGDVPVLHVSTSFVAGNRKGLVFEDEEVRGYFPRRGELDGRDFSLEQELVDCDKQVARLREQADDRALTSDFRQRALERLDAEGRDANDEKTLRLAVGRERKLWLSRALAEAGMERAKRWGWPNTYTYTKSLGEQVLAGTPGIRYAIVRPSIVESALRFPFPGWNEGFTTSAPLCFASLKGHRGVPASDSAVLDIIPVDQVAGAMLGIAAHTMTVRERRVYQLASGDSNPFYASRSVELVGLYRRRYFKSRETGSPLLNELKSRIEPQAVSRTAFDLRSAPMFKRGAQWLKEAIAENRPSWGAPTVSAWLDKATEKLTEVEQQATSLVMLIETFLPFIWENRYVFRCDNTRSVYAQMSDAGRAEIPWDPESVNWRRYFLETHLPGLEKWVFPGLEEETQRRTTIPAHRDLLELLEASIHTHRHRVALRRVEGDRELRFTYGELDRYAARVGSFLLRAGIQPQARVLLASESRPEWAMAYFGILRAGATVVPIDPDLSADEVVNLARRSEAAVCLVSEDAAQNLSGLFKALAEAGLTTQVHSLAQAMEGDPSQPDRIGDIRRSASADDVASLIFTSGTTGQPKGVMLTHRNFTSLVAKLAGRFEVGPGDGLLSVLPLHHTFEFSCGLLVPLARGADITYLDTLNADRLADVFATGRITAMIGVPALWQLLHRKLTQELAAGPAFVESGVKALMSAHAELRNRKDVNLGKLLFWPVHKRIGGGRLKFMVSGGAALPQDVHEAFHALGFQLTEGYGLTEAAPVLTVGDRENVHRPGSVGRALPGIELRIDQPDADGVGEVLARGPTVMAGYFGDPEATAETIADGWLRTGDLGKLDGDGRLHLAGRKKDVIVDANGKNVYPDELEDLYSKHTHVRELSVVGLPDESGERVACLCVPDYRGRPREEVRHELEEHFRSVSGQMPFYRRVKVLHFWDGDLPRTSTRKVKRRQVIEELRKLERAAATGLAARQKASTDGEGDAWVLSVVADVSQRPVDQVRRDSRLVADLGFDSLMMTELSVALEQAGVALPSLENLARLETVADLAQLLASRPRRPAPEARAQEISREVAQTQETDVSVPAPVARLGKDLLSLGQRLLYGGVFQVEVSGKAFIPQNRNCLVVANHTSHLDMGLVKVVLGDQGDRLAALAARDYFFDTTWKRAYFENFTNLIPMDRQGSLRESLRLAGDALDRGMNLLIFPEGTRSPNGELQEFKPTLGFLALTYDVDILPLYLAGTHDALPKGALFPKHTQLAVRIGPVLSRDAMRRQTEGMARSESYRHVTALAERAVRSLMAGKPIDLNAASDGEPRKRPHGTGRTTGHGGGHRSHGGSHS